MIHIPGTASFQSSIPSPTGLSRRDTYDQTASQRFNGSPDPLNGSLGPFFASCALVFIVVLVVVSVLWGVHRGVSPRVARNHSPLTAEELADPTRAPDLKFPPDRLRIRTPIQRLKLLRSGSSASTIPLWTSPKTSSTNLVVPDIVISRASPIYSVSPSLTTSAAPSIASTGKLEVPGTKKVPLLQFQQPLGQTSGNRQPSRLQAKISSPTKGDKVPVGHGGKLKKLKLPANKENQLPQADARPKRAKRIFGSRDDTWSQLM